MKLLTFAEDKQELFSMNLSFASKTLSGLKGHIPLPAAASLPESKDPARGSTLRERNSPHEGKKNTNNEGL